MADDGRMKGQKATICITLYDMRGFQMKTTRNLIWLTLAALLLLGLAAPLAQAQDSLPYKTETCVTPSWSGELYQNAELSGPAAYILCRRLIDFVWGGGQPMAYVDHGRFSTRWRTRQAFYLTGTYEFMVRVEGSARFFINGTPVIDSFIDGSTEPRTLKTTFNITTPGQVLDLMIESAHYPGNASLRVDSYLIAGQDAQILADHQAALRGAGFGDFTAGGGDVWVIDHFIGASLPPIGTPGIGAAVHVADGISYNYRETPAEPDFPLDNWSSRWTRPVVFRNGTYTFYMRADDLGRVLVDGQVVIDWTAGAGIGSIQLSAGRHVVIFEHIKTQGDGSVFLTWDPPVGTMLFPDGCNAEYMAGVNGLSPLCPERGLATFQ
jgi:hypothetical protein